MSVQDPFVLDHNTTSNVSERLRCDIVREFQRAGDHCRNLIGCSDVAEHAGIVELLSDAAASSVSSPAGSVQLALSPQSTTGEDRSSAVVSEESAHMQLFVLRFQDSADATAAAEDVGHAATEQKHKLDAVGMGAPSRCNEVVGMVKLMLADIFDVDCVYRSDGPTGQLDSQLSQLLTAETGPDTTISVQGSLTESSPPLSARSCTADSIQLPSDRKHLLPEDLGDADDDDSDDNGDNDSSRRRSQSAKRHRSSDGKSDAVSGSSSRQLDVANNWRCIPLSVDCCARSRLWVGRKKVRRQFLHFSDELKRQLEVSSTLRKDVAKTDDAIVEFELAIVRPASRRNDELLMAVLPSKKTSKEFGCFITYFISLVQKLVHNITVEGPVTTQFK